MLVYGVRALIALIIRGWLRTITVLKLLGMKISHQPIARHRGKSFQSSGPLCLLARCPTQCIALSRLRRRIIFSKACRATFVRRRGDQCAALCAASSRSPEPLHLLGTPQRSQNILIIFRRHATETGETRDQIGNRPQSSPGETSTVLPAYGCRALFARAEGGVCRVQKKFDSLLARLAIIRRAMQTRSTSAQSQRNCIAR